jgi:hypothetical protein
MKESHEVRPGQSPGPRVMRRDGCARGEREKGVRVRRHKPEESSE